MASNIVFRQTPNEKTVFFILHNQMTFELLKIPMTEAAQTFAGYDDGDH